MAMLSSDWLLAELLERHGRTFADEFVSACRPTGWGWRTWSHETCCRAFAPP